MGSETEIEACWVDNQGVPVPQDNIMGGDDKGFVLFLSGCCDNQTSKELTFKDSDGDIKKRGGALTFAMLDCVEKHEESCSSVEKLVVCIIEAVKDRDQRPSVWCSHTFDTARPFKKVL